MLSGLGGSGSLFRQAFDPKVIYDHFAGRWVMVYLAVNTSIQQSWILVSVSDDSDPTGAWCNWALRGDRNGSAPSGNWADYQGLGYDDQAIYIVPNQFSFAGFFDYTKIRILPKSTLYNTSCPAITWTDLWDLRFPPQPAGAEFFATFNVRPAVTFGTPGVEYLVSHSILIPPNNNFMVLYSLTNPLTSPNLTAQAVPIAPWNFPPDANQLGGSTPGPNDPNCANPCLIDVGGDRLRNAVYRDGSVWTTHSVADPTGKFPNARYMRIGVAGPTVLEDASIGTSNCLYYYPAITTDSDSNMAMVFSRSCDDEYAGMRYTTKLNGGALKPSALVKAGEANYVKTFGCSRNRWGDYSGIAVDPADQSIWMFAEYAESPPGFFGGTWGTWFGRVRFSGISAPALIHPEDREFLHDTTSLFLWGPSSGGVVDYSLQVTSGDIDTGPFDLDVVTADATQYQVQPGEAFSAGTYSWHVIARDAGAINTASSVTRTFIIGVHPEHPPDQAPSQGTGQYSVAGSVVLEGMPSHIAGARVTFTTDSTVERVLSDPDDGSFEIYLAPGTYSVTIEKDAFLPWTRADLVVDHDIALPAVKLLGGDVNGDGVVDIRDLMITSKHQGHTESP